MVSNAVVQLQGHSLLQNTAVISGTVCSTVTGAVCAVDSDAVSIAAR